jgi:CRISPR-associated protein Cst2
VTANIHVKYEADRRKVAVPAPRGEGTIAGAQTVFHRPANSGNYALICHLELSRIGVNDVTRECALTAESAADRRRAAVQALIATLVRPAGAQCNTQSPHIVECSGVVTLSRSYLPAPMLSPLSESYRAEIESIVETMNRLTPEMIEARPFETLAQGIERLERTAAGV